MASIYNCIACEFTTPQKNDMRRHMDRKKPCNQENPVKFTKQVKNMVLDRENPEYIKLYINKQNKRNKRISVTQNLNVPATNSYNNNHNTTIVNNIDNSVQNIDNLVQNIDNLITIDNSININFVINDFDKSSENMITEDLIKKIVQATKEIHKDREIKIVLNMIESKHFNPEYPQNHNIAKTNLKSSTTKFIRRGIENIEESNILNKNLALNAVDSFMRFAYYKKLPDWLKVRVESIKKWDNLTGNDEPEDKYEYSPYPRLNNDIDRLLYNNRDMFLSSLKKYKKLLKEN